MSKNKNKNKATAQTTAPKAPVEKPADAKTEKEATATTQTKEDPKPAAPAAAKTPEKPKKQQENKPAAQASTQKPKPKKEPHVPTVIGETVEEDILAKKLGIPSTIPIGSTGCSGDGKAMLAYVGYQRFANNEEFKKEYPEAYAATVRAVDVVWLLGMIDVQKEMLARNESGELKLTLPVDQIIPLQDTAKMLGIEIAAGKLLPDGKQMEIPFEQTKAPEDLVDYTRTEEARAKELDL